MLAAKSLFVVQVSRERVFCGLCTSFCGRSCSRDIVRCFSDLSFCIVASAVVVIEDGVLGSSFKAVNDSPFEFEITTETVLGHLPVVECLVERSRLLVLVGAAGRPSAVIIELPVGRAHHKSTSYGIEIVAGKRVLDGSGEVECGGSDQSLGDVERGVAVHREQFVSAHRHHAVVLKVADGGCVFHVLASSVHTDILLVPQSIGEPLALPVRVGECQYLGRVQRVIHPLPAVFHEFILVKVSGREDVRVLVSGSCGIGTVEDY